MEQISSLLAAAAVGGFAITAVAGKFMIPALHRLHFGQTIREEGPTWHSKKNGTPTMGGLCFILGILATLGIVWVMYSPKLPEVLGMPQLQAGMLVLFLAFGSGLIGFLDDFIKVVKHRNLGLTEAQKMILQIALTFGFMFGLHSLGLLTTQVQFPIFGLVDMGLLYYPIAFFGIIFLVNAVNLTDGLDGLCTGVTFVSMIGYLLAGSLLGFVHVSLIAAATKIAEEESIKLQYGVYVGGTGPTFETQAEYRYFKAIGGDAAGMSTVPEVIVARHMSIPVFGVSVITNCGLSDEVGDHEDVQRQGKKAGVRMELLFRRMIKNL